MTVHLHWNYKKTTDVLKSYAESLGIPLYVRGGYIRGPDESFPYWEALIWPEDEVRFGKNLYKLMKGADSIYQWFECGHAGWHSSAKRARDEFRDKNPDLMKWITLPDWFH
jgi:hypothetical protein